MKTQFIRAASLSSVLLLSAGAAHAEFGFTPRVNAGVMNYSYKLTINNLQSGAGGVWHKVSDTVGILGIGGTVSFDRFFVDIYGQMSGEGNGTYTYDLADPRVPGNEMDFEREDYAISLGYALHENLSLFAGYKWGKTDFSESYNPQTGGGFLEYFDTEFKEDGPFVGAAIGWPVGNGLVAINIAVAMLDAENNQTKVGQAGSYLDFSGDTVGVNFGVSWRAPITDNLSYSLSLDGYRYSFDPDSVSGSSLGGASGDPRDLNLAVKAKEDAVAIKAGIAYRF